VSGLRAAIRSARPVLTAELGPPRDADPKAVLDKAAILRGWVDAANVTDNQGANVRMSSLAASVLALRAGLEPVMQLTCRDRNRMALQSDLLGAAALGVPNVLLLTGDHPTLGDHPESRPVFDLDGVQLTWAARTLRDEGTNLAGRPLTHRPDYLIGTVENPFAAPTGLRARRLAKKVAAGAEFVQTQYVFDVAGFARWMDGVRELGVTERCAVLAGVGPIRSLRMHEFLSTKVPGLFVPEAVGRRLRGVPPDRVAEEGLRICVETIHELLAIPGVGGVHVMAVGNEAVVPEIAHRAGIGPSTDPVVGASEQEGSAHAG
jgi:methylenetetrahydrofolate reductase (NADH)